MSTVSGSSNYVFKFESTGILALFDETIDYINSEAKRGRYWKPVRLETADGEHRVHLEEVDTLAYVM